MKSLLEGIEIFQHKVFPEYEELFADLATGQSPEVLLITCSDSRIDPSLVTQTKPGQLFLIRNAGNIVPAYGKGGGEEATVEYAIRVLGVRNVVVCGHTDCGAMKGVLQPETLTALPSVQAWLKPAAAARRRLASLPPDADDDMRLRNLIEENVVVQLKNLKTHPAVAEALEKGDLLLSGTVYDIKTGEFFRYSEEKEEFERLGR